MSERSDEFRFPEDDELPPYQRHSPTSREAAERIRPNAGTLRAMVLEFIMARGEAGATDEEVQAALSLSGSTQRPRRVELCDAGLVVDAGLRRETASGRRAVAWVASEMQARAEAAS